MTAPSNAQIHEAHLLRGHYYVVEVQLFPGNWKHRAIVRCIDESMQLLDFLTYESQTHRRVKDLFYIKVVSEITDMNKLVEPTE